MMKTVVASVLALAASLTLSECAPEAGSGGTPQAGGGAVNKARGITVVVEMEPAFGRKTAVDISLVVDGNGRSYSRKSRFVKVVNPEFGVGVRATAYEKGTIKCYFIVGGTTQNQRTTILEGPHPVGSVECHWATQPQVGG